MKTKQSSTTGNTSLGEHCYYYLHTNGSLIHKNAFSVDSMGAGEYFDSDFVRMWWRIDLGNRADAWNLLIAASVLGANPDEITHLSEFWECTDEDGKVFCERNGLRLEPGIRSKWVVTDENETMSVAGSGETVLDAIIMFAKQSMKL